MTGKGRSDDKETSLRMANELVKIANDKLETGLHPLDIASAIRHSGANFTAFAYAQGTDDALDTQSVMEEFLQWLEHYDKLHREKKARPLTDLERLVEQVKNE